MRAGAEAEKNIRNAMHSLMNKFHTSKVRDMKFPTTALSKRPSRLKKSKRAQKSTLLFSIMLRKISKLA